MGIEEKHAYRFGFLKSEKWQAVRIEALARQGGRCQFCSEFSISNDAHHIRYPENIYDTCADDLIILCRACHNLTHSILKVHQITSHTIKQLCDLGEAFRTWKEEKVEWMEDGIAQRKPTKLPRCHMCKRRQFEIECGKPMVIPGVGIRPLDVEMCSDCFFDFEQKIKDGAPTTARQFWRSYEQWKIARRLSFGIKSDPKEK